jgi:hypothetical protein
MDLMRQVLGAIDPNTMARMGAQLGMDGRQTQGAIEAALPLLLGQMARNTAQPGGADALLGAVRRDHSAVDLGGLLGGLLGGSGSGGGGAAGALGAVLGALGGGSAAGTSRGNDPMSQGMAILGHVFGARQQRASNGLGQMTGLGGSQATQLLAMLAPIVMAVLGRQTQQRGLDASALGGLLGSETNAMRTSGNPMSGALGALLDTDGDGDVDLADLMKVGGSLMGGMGRR